MASEGFQGCLGELHGATAALGLRSSEHRASLRCGQRAPHLQRPCLKVNVAPLEAKQLALPEPGVNGEDVEGFEPVVPHGLEQYLHLLCGQRSYLLLTCGGLTASVALREMRPSLMTCLRALWRVTCTY